MIINKVKQLLDKYNLTAYKLAVKSGICINQIYELSSNPDRIPRRQALDRICRYLNCSIDDILEHAPNRISARSNLRMNKARPKQNYYTMADYDAIKKIRENHERNEALIF